MARRPTRRQTPGLESLETRQLLSGGVAPTAEKQYMLELVNLVRTNPRAAADRLTSNLSRQTRDTLNFYGVDLAAAKDAIANVRPRQPLAWNDALGQAAEDHSRDMADKGFQSHEGSDGSTSDQRADRAGYGRRRKVIENAFAYAESVDQAMQAFTLDWGVAGRPHLRNMTDPDGTDADSAKEIGIGIVQSGRPGFAKVVTQNFGLREDGPTYLLGVAYSDNDHDDFYTPGEGQGGVTIELTDDRGQVVQTTSGEAGGYQIPLAPGHYRLRASLDGRDIRRQDVTIGTQNVKVDFDLTDPWSPPADPAPAPVAVAAPAVVPTVPVQPAPPDTSIEPRPITATVDAVPVVVQGPTQPMTVAPPERVTVVDDTPKVVDAPKVTTTVEARVDRPDASPTLRADAVDLAILGGGPKITDWETWDFVPMA